ncbi:MAG: hypothetical protein H7Y88_09465 [Phycisphaerales bacterium]|nr:hypothetical protein [Phycisphaerales bacterium]
MTGTYCLAQTTGKATAAEVLVIVGVLIVCVLALGIGILVLRRRLLTKESASAAAGSVFEHLRQLHAKGELSDDEFRIARERMANRMRGPRDRESEPARARERPNPRNAAGDRRSPPGY